MPPLIQFGFRAPLYLIILESDGTLTGVLPLPHEECEQSQRHDVHPTPLQVEGNEHMFFLGRR